MTMIGKLLEEFKKIEQGLEISENSVIIESEDEEEIKIPKQEYAIVMSTLNTWLLTSKQYGRKKYLQKEINTDNGAFIYSYKKLKGKYIVIYKKEIS